MKFEFIKYNDTIAGFTLTAENEEEGHQLNSLGGIHESQEFTSDQEFIYNGSLWDWPHNKLKFIQRQHKNRRI